MLRPLMLALLGTSFTFLMTALGAATVFFFARKVCERAQGALLGFAAGVMMAASVWSLILPAIEQTEAEGPPAAVSARRGGHCARRADALPARRARAAARRGEVHSDFLLLSAITLHNIPEGMAVGLAFALAADGESLAGAFALAAWHRRAELSRGRGGGAAGVPGGQVETARLLDPACSPARWSRCSACSSCLRRRECTR